MIFNFLVPKKIPGQVRDLLIDATNTHTIEDNNKAIDIKADSDFINRETSLIFENILNCQDEQEVISMYIKLNEFKQYSFFPPVFFQDKVMNDALQIENAKVSKQALQYLSYFAQKDISISNQLLSNINVGLLKNYCMSPEIDVDVFELLETFFTFSNDIPKYCSFNDIYQCLSSGHDTSGDKSVDQLFYNISLIKTVAKSFRKEIIDNLQVDLARLIERISCLLGNLFIPDRIHELIVDSFFECFIRFSNSVSEKNNHLSFMTYQTFDVIFSLWNVTNINQRINHLISWVLFLFCYFNPDDAGRRRVYTWISARFVNNLDDEILVLFISSLVILIGYDQKYANSNGCAFAVLVDKTVSKIYDILLNGSFLLKNISVQFFWQLCYTKSSKVIAFLEEHRIAEVLLDFFGDLEDIPLKSALDGILALILRVEQNMGNNQNFNDNPIICQIKTQHNFEILNRVAIENEVEETRCVAKMIIDKVFIDSGECQENDNHNYTHENET